MRYGAIIRAEVKDKRPKKSPLVQGGLEILIGMSVMWDDAVKIKIIKEKLETVQIGDQSRPNTDHSSEILREMRIDADEKDEES